MSSVVYDVTLFDIRRLHHRLTRNFLFHMINSRINCPTAHRATLRANRFLSAPFNHLFLQSFLLLQIVTFTFLIGQELLQILPCHINLYLIPELFHRVTSHSYVNQSKAYIMEWCSNLLLYLQPPHTWYGQLP